MVKMEVEGQPLDMELDTGSAVYILPLSLMENKFRGIRSWRKVAWC